MKKITKKETRKKKQNEKKQEFKDFKNITFEEENDENPFITEPNKVRKQSVKASNKVENPNITIKRKVNKKRIILIVALTINFSSTSVNTLCVLFADNLTALTILVSSKSTMLPSLLITFILSSFL